MTRVEELQKVFEIFRHDHALVLEVGRALDWAAERAGVALSAEERDMFKFAVVSEVDGMISVKCASKGCNGCC